MPNPPVQYRHPTIEDGAHLWRIARDSRTLDVNAPYAYLLWCRDFAATSVVATMSGDDEPVGFATGYLRPDEPATFMVWQVAVNADARGRGTAAGMLDWLFAVNRREHPEVTHLETTITADNAASRALFAAFADRHGAAVARTPLFVVEDFPEASGGIHETELLHRIGPIPA